MKGKYKIRVQNTAVRFEFEIERNINILRGDSGTGKTTLVAMIIDYQSQGTASGVELVCKKNCVALTGLGNNWKIFLSAIHDSIVFIDEGESYVRTKEFASFIKKTDNYYVIATRNNLYEIPYSVDAIFEVKSSGKYGSLKTTYNHFERMYSAVDISPKRLKDYEVIITEDSNSGFDFFSKVGKDHDIACISSDGKSNVLKVAKDNSNSKELIIADGAAFGPEMANVYKLTSENECRLFLPESFEWMLLDSDVLKDSEIRTILEKPYNYIESEKYFSWENYFTDILIDKTNGKPSQYNKKTLNKFYLSDKNVKSVLERFFHV
ncbi:hypothetical protein SAMN02910384_02328 [Pseudobutyrivibrio sp. ACV-2]|uniref:translation initiation factor 2 n=1 Tax=Pseudobutyrivibrio sp. ACV-2 TaxID=1520801 RepID=UPI00089B6E6E|nr:translation initiation factor 2 [Pseudobutyrivibrio sp. ACV-2]SEA77991.1 hypothetical protein SAMN02910384_02328 [Pseudobutyrivibrio sp. ACV-2]